MASLLRPSHPGITLGANDGALGWAGKLQHRLGPGDGYFLPDPHFAPFMADFRLNFGNYSLLSLILSFIQEGEKHTRVSLEEETL